MERSLKFAGKKTTFGFLFLAVTVSCVACVAANNAGGESKGRTDQHAAPLKLYIYDKNGSNLPSAEYVNQFGRFAVSLNVPEGAGFDRQAGFFVSGAWEKPFVIGFDEKKAGHGARQTFLMLAVQDKKTGAKFTNAIDINDGTFGSTNQGFRHVTLQGEQLHLPQQFHIRRMGICKIEKGQVFIDKFSIDGVVKSKTTAQPAQLYPFTLPIQVYSSGRTHGGDEDAGGGHSGGGGGGMGGGGDEGGGGCTGGGGGGTGGGTGGGETGGGCTDGGGGTGGGETGSGGTGNTTP